MSDEYVNVKVNFCLICRMKVKKLQTQERVFNVICETFELDNKIKNITFDTDLRSIGINSLLFAKLLVALENEFTLEFDDNRLDYNKMQTINEISAHVNEIIKSKAV